MGKLTGLRPYYVYVLMDSSTKRVFYVGKGQGERIFQHTKEVEKGTIETEKQKEIHRIEHSGSSVSKFVIGRFDTDKEAFTVESILIHWVYGIENLKNKQSGHGSHIIRKKGDLTSMLPPSRMYYVYILIDGRDGSVFYVGKGKDSRAFQHEKEAHRGLAETEKQKRIEIIHKSGSVFVPLIVGYHPTEKQALAVESSLIHWVYGRETLTNDQSGHGYISIRPKDNYSTLQGIDEPELGYCERRADDRERNDIIRFLSEIRDVVERECNFKFDDFDTHNPRHTYLYKIYKGVKFTIVSHHTPRRAAAVTIEAIDTKEVNKARVRYICDNTKLEWKDGGRYGRIMPAKPYRNVSAILEKFKETYSELQKIAG
jgi:hypothetical protein